jgi:hypothetical protein
MPQDNAPVSPAKESAPPVNRKRLYGKFVLFILLLILPGYFAVIFTWGILFDGILEIRVEQEGAVDPQTAAAYEQPLLDALKPLLSEKYGREEFSVIYTRPGWFIGEHRIRDAKKNEGGVIRIRLDGWADADWKDCYALAEDIARMKRDLPGMPECLYILNFRDTGNAYPKWTLENAAASGDDAIYGSLCEIAIPDAMHGYSGGNQRREEKWHIDDFTPTKDPDEVRK